jgi:hypothetical protein
VGVNLPTNIAFGLLADFLVSTEKALKEKNISANLRFAHAETIIPFASLMQLPGCSTQTNHLNQVEKIWKNYEVAPMAANIQWILYTNSKNTDYLIKVLYNEQEIKLPLESFFKVYYKWEDVKAFYFNVIQHLQLERYEGESLEEMVKNYTVALN